MGRLKTSGGLSFGPGQYLQIAKPRVSAGSAWWADGLAAYDAKNAVTYAASKLDLTGNGNHATEGVAPTWANGTGWTLNGTTEYLKTGIIPTSGYSMFIQYTNAGLGNRHICGQFLSGARFFIAPQNTNTTAVTYGSGGLLQASPMFASGNLGVAGQQGYRNGVADGGAIGAWTTTTTQDIYIGGSNVGGALAAPESGTVIAWIVYNHTRTPSQVAALAAAMAAL